MSVAETPSDAVRRTLRAVKDLRLNVAYSFEGLARGPVPPQGAPAETQRRVFLSEVRDNLNKVAICMKTLEVAAENMQSPAGTRPQTHSLGGLLSAENNEERSNLYLDMKNAYNWMDKLQQVARHAHRVLVHHMPVPMTKAAYDAQFRPPEGGSAQVIENVVKNSRRLDREYKIEVARPYGASSTILMVTLGKILKAVLVLRETVIEHVVVRAYSEEFLTEDGEVDIWSGSRYQVFRKVTDQADIRAVTLTLSENASPLKMFLSWLSFYRGMFSTPCRRCSHYLKDFELPILLLPRRDVDAWSFSAVHASCMC